MNKVILLTGASGGIGKATAKLLVEKGFNVYGTTTKLSAGNELKQFGVKVIELDVTQEESMKACVKHILDIEGRIDVLINNAGFGLYGSVEDVSIDKARFQMEVNLFGVARMIQLVLPKMREQKFGKIINISSGAGRFSTPYGGWYHSSKYALEGLSDALRNEVKQFGIDVVIIEPGSIKSEFSGIAMDNLVKNSQTSAYKEAIERVANSYKSMGKNDSDPIVIAKLILQAILSNNPKTRYVGGFGLKPTLILKWLLSDKMFDRFLKSSLKF